MGCIYIKIHNFYSVEQLQASVACVSVSGVGWATRSACVERHPLGDGVWHTVVAERHGHNLLVSVDDGDGWRRNETLASLAAAAPLGSPPSLVVDKHNGVTVGGLPEFEGVDLVTVHDDLRDGECCLRVMLRHRIQSHSHCPSSSQ